MARFFIITEFGDVFRTDDEQYAKSASEYDQNIVIDAQENKTLYDGVHDGELIEEWEDEDIE